MDAGTKPLALIWEVTGGTPFGEDDQDSGNGLDGALFSVGGGVCYLGSCEVSGVCRDETQLPRTAICD